MVDAARAMLDELMGRNRNLHPSEANRKITWDDPDFCQYYIVKFCPHDLFINTRADLGPCHRLHDDEAKSLYEKARPTARKRQFEDEFLRFCITMLNDVDRKIQKGKQRLQLMQRDTSQTTLSKYQEQLNNLNGRIKKLLSEAEEAGIRGDVDQAQDLMILCEKLKDEKDSLVMQRETNIANKAKQLTIDKQENSNSPKSNDEQTENGGSVSPISNGGVEKKPWVQETQSVPEKQMEVCEVCGAFLIVGDAQQRIEDHLMGKQHLGYSKLRKAVDEIHEKRQKERDEEERKRREERESKSAQRNSRNHENDRRRDDYRDHHRRERDGGGNQREDNYRHSSERHRHHHKNHRRSRSPSRGRSSRSRSHRHTSRDRYTRSRSRSRY